MIQILIIVQPRSILCIKVWVRDLSLCSVVTEHIYHCGYTQYFRGILFLLSNTQYFQRVNIDYTKEYVIISGVDTAFTRKYAVFPEGRYFFY